MAVAGGAMPSCRVRIVDGKLVADMWQTRQSSMLEDDVIKAAERLRKGETVYLRTTGSQYMQLKAMFTNDDEGEVKE